MWLYQQIIEQLKDKIRKEVYVLGEQTCRTKFIPNRLVVVVES